MQREDQAEDQRAEKLRNTPVTSNPAFLWASHTIRSISCSSPPHLRSLNVKNSPQLQGVLNVNFVNLRASNLTGTQAARAYANGCMSTVNNSFYLSDVRLPRSVCLTVGVGHIVTECNALTADAALCHIITPPSMDSFNQTSTLVIIPQVFLKCNRYRTFYFTKSQIFLTFFKSICLFQRINKFFHAVECLCNMLNRVRIGDSCISLTAVTEGCTGYYCYSHFIKKPLAELLGTHTEL